MNSFLLYILLCIGIYILNNFIIKLRASMLLKIIYRLIYFEKRPVFFHFSQSINQENHYMVWNKEIYEVKKIILDGLGFEKYTNFYSTIGNDVFTYNEYLILCDKFNEYIIDKNLNLQKKMNLKNQWIC